MKKVCLYSVTLAFGLLAAALGEKVSAQHSSGNILINSGFRMYGADNPAKLAILKAMPANKFIPKKTKHGDPYYIYADPGLCVCAYVGNQKAMDSYRQKWSALTPEQLGSVDSNMHPVEENMLYDMQNDDLENRFNRDVLGPDFFTPGYVPGFNN